MGEQSLERIQAIKAYRIKHGCSLQEALAAMTGVEPPAPGAWKADMTDRTTTLGQVEEMIASVFRRSPDMSGDGRARLYQHEYRLVQDAAREIVAFLSTPLDP